MKINSKKSLLNRKNIDVVSVKKYTISNGDDIRDIKEFEYKDYADIISQITINEIEYVSRGDPEESDDPEFNSIKEVESFSVKNLRRVNGIFHFRKMIKGKPVQFTLDTTSIRDAMIKIAGMAKIRLHDRARNMIEKMNHKVEKNEDNKDDNKKNSVQELYGLYLRTCEMQGLSVRTMYMKKQMKNQLHKLHVKSTNQFNQDTITRVTETWKNKYARNTQLKYRSELKAFLNFLIKQGVVRREEYDKLIFLTGKVKAKELIIQPNDLTIIFDYLKKNDMDFYLYISTLFYTISRPGEIRKIQVKDVNFTENKVTIYISKTARLGRDKKIIPLFPEISELLSDHINSKGLQKNDYLFDGASSSNENYYGKKFSRLKKILKFNEEYTLYTYRHTSETALYSLTKNAKLISEMAGHDVSMALGTYVNYDIDRLKEQIKGVTLL